MAPSSGLKSQPAVAPSPSTTSASELIYHVRENVRSANAVKACFSSLCALSRDKATKEYVVRNFALVTQVMAAHARRNAPQNAAGSTAAGRAAGVFFGCPWDAHYRDAVRLFAFCARWFITRRRAGSQIPAVARHFVGVSISRSALL